MILKISQLKINKLNLEQKLKKKNQMKNFKKFMKEMKLAAQLKI